MASTSFRQSVCKSNDMLVGSTTHGFLRETFSRKGERTVVRFGKPFLVAGEFGSGLTERTTRGPTKKIREAYALGQRNKEAFLRGGEDAINPYWVGDAGVAYMAGEDDRYVPQWDPSLGGPQPDWWDPNPID